MSKATRMELHVKASALHPQANNDFFEVGTELSESILAISGDSGSGKTTLLQRIAGIDHRSTKTSKLPTSAQLNQMPFEQLLIAENPCVYVGSDTPLIEHLSLRKNLSLTQNMSIWVNQRERVFNTFQLEPLEALTLDELIEICELAEFIEKPCYQLSGGEKQRGQLARALICGKPILLLDEALSAMDLQLRGRIQMQLKRLHTQKRRGIVMVSHSIREVLSISDQVAVLSKGHLQHFGDTLAIDNPLSNSLVAGTQNEISTLRVRFLREELEHGLSVFSLEVPSLAGSALQHDDKHSAQYIYCKHMDNADEIERLLIDASSIVITRQDNVQSSMLNCLNAHISGVEEIDDRVMISLKVNAQLLKAQITKKSFTHLNLQLGDRVNALFKAL